ncbi:MAG TPA: class I SAM-dependent methyltransferase [Candidatus Bathyarchaeia archaeon]|nr:class I SAM-dependent methyltransferase [Candidatus Bathyarchaeia archaeon]
MKIQALYTSQAIYYDLLYSGKEYKKESQQIKKIITKYKKSKGNDLLDCACGTGNHLQYFIDDFNCIGTDLNPAVLEIAREKLPTIEFIEADMSDLNLNRKFDVITCLYSSIGYITKKDRVESAIRAFSKHLKPGGILIVEPWLTKEMYNVDDPVMNIYNGDDIKIARLYTLELKNDNISHFEQHILVAERGKKVKHFVDLHELAMFPMSDFISWFEKYDMYPTLLPQGLFDDRGLLIGVKRGA